MAEGGSKLSEEEIFHFLKSINVPLRMQDIKVPSSDFIIRVFEFFLKDLQIDFTELRTWVATDHIEDGDIYEDAQLLLLLAMSVNHITGPCGLNITVKDIVEPKPKRTKKILNYLIVFWNYYFLKCARFDAVKKSYEGDRINAENLALENQSLDEKFTHMSKTLEDMQPKEELSSIRKIKEEKAAKLHTESDTLGSDYQALKTKEVNIRSQIGATDVQIITAKERLEELSQLILSSPERINTEIKRLQERIKTEDSKIKELEDKNKNTLKALELQEESLKEEEKVLNALKETDETIKILRDTVKSIVDVHQNISKEDDEVKKLEMDLERKKRENIQLKQKSAKVALNSKKQVETLKGVLKTYQSEEVKFGKEVEVLKAAVNNLQEDLDSESDKILCVIEMCKEAQAKTKEREAQFKVKLREMSDQFKSDCEEVISVMQSSS